MQVNILEPLHSVEKVLIDPSMLLPLAQLPLREHVPAGIILYTPGNLITLIERSEAPNYRAFLVDFAMHFSHRPRWTNAESFNVRLLIDNISRLRENQILRTIDIADIDVEILETLQDMVFPRKFDIQLSPQSNFLRDYLLSMLSYSKNHSVPIWMRTRKLTRWLNEYFPVMELPSRMERLFESKNQLCNMIFDFPYGRSVKFFLGAIVNISSSSWPLEIGSMVFLLMDP